MSNQHKKTAALLRRHVGALKIGVGATALAVSMFSTGTAFAQSTASQIDEIIVTGQRGEKTIGGLITPEQAPKARSTVSQEFIQSQPDGQSAGQLINMLPGVNFTSEDAYGNSGGNIRLRGFDGSRISLTWDGIPLNDTGNYSTYFNQTMDSEVADRVAVNLGTTDVDSPTPSAIGGTINIVTRVPDDEASVLAKAAYGTDSYRRFFAMVDSGKFGPYDTKAFLSASYTKYDNFKGPGDIEKKQINGRIYQPLKDDDFVSVAFHYNENRKDFLRRLTKAQVAQFGWDLDYDTNITTSGNAFNTNYYGVQINPSNTGNIRGQSKFSLSDSVTLTVDPYIQYTLANGGGSTGVAEQGNLTYPFLLSGLDRTRYKGVDLNGNCAAAVSGPNGVRLIPNSASSCTPETVRLYSPNNTNTWRPGVTTSLIWEINDQNRVRVGYTLDYGRHRQTGEFGYIVDGQPENIFGGKEGQPVYAANGAILQRRNRYSVAELNQVSAEYTGKFLEDNLNVTIGARAPFFKRELNNYCYSETFNASCTTDPAYAPAASVPVRGRAAPFLNKTVKYDDVLPNVGVSYRLTDEQMIYASFAEGFKLPSTDNLYNPLVDVVPEKTKTFDLGYRYQGAVVTGSIGAWYTDYKNRIDSTWDDEAQASFDQNIGDVKAYGADAEIGFELIEDLVWYMSASYNHSRYKDDVDGNGVVYAVADKRVVETPDWQLGTRLSYTWADFTFGSDVKFVGKRYSTHVNDEWVGAYTTVDLDVRYDLETLTGLEGSSLKFNVDNLFDRRYYGSITQSMNATGVGAVAPTYNIGAPRSAQVSLTMKF